MEAWPAWLVARSGSTLEAENSRGPARSKFYRSQRETESELAWALSDVRVGFGGGQAGLAVCAAGRASPTRNSRTRGKGRGSTKCSSPELLSRRDPVSARDYHSRNISVTLIDPQAARLRRVSTSGRVTKIAIDKRTRESENKGHEESLAAILPASGRLRGEEAVGCGEPASNTEPAAATHCRTHRTLCSSQAGKCQHRDLQLSARDHRDRFKNAAHHASLQGNERRKMRPGAPFL